MPLERIYRSHAKMLELGLVPQNDEDDLTKSPPATTFGLEASNETGEGESTNENGKRKGEDWIYPMKQTKVRKGLNDWLSDAPGGSGSGSAGMDPAQGVRDEMEIERELNS